MSRITAFQEEGGYDETSVQSIEAVEQLTGMTLEGVVEEQAVAVQAICAVSDACKLRGLVSRTDKDDQRYADPGMWVDTTIPVVTVESLCGAVDQCPSDTPVKVLGGRLRKIKELAGTAVATINERTLPILSEGKAEASRVRGQGNAVAKETILDPAEQQAQAILAEAQARADACLSEARAQADTYLEPSRHVASEIEASAEQQAAVVRAEILGEVMSEVTAISPEGAKLF